MRTQVRFILPSLPRSTPSHHPRPLPNMAAWILRGKNAQAPAQEAAAEAPKQASSLLLQRAHEQRSDCSSGVLGMLVEAMTFGGMEHAEHATALVSHRMRCAFDAIAETIWQRNGLAFPASSECTAQLSSAANCARCKYRLTPHGTDRRSNRQRFTNEQRGRWCRRRKSMALRCVFAAVCIATSQLFRWRVQFGLTVRKRRNSRRVILADGAVNQVPEPSALRDLVPPPEGMTVIRMEIARSRRDGAASSPSVPHLSEGCSVQWRAIWPFSCSFPRGTYVGR